MKSGHTAEEKIKILYEDSLAEIRELTGRLESIKTVVGSLPSAVDKEMKRAGAETISVLSAEVGKIAQKIAGDAATAEKSKAISLAVQWATAGVLSCAVVFGGTGYALRMGSDAVNMSTARDRVVEANERADAAIAAAEKSASEEIEQMQKSVGWMGTEQGRLAKRFFDLGWGEVAAKCNSPVWEIMDRGDEKYCVPKRRELFGGDEKVYGWKIP